ncbi:unnamed protein product [Symbiodinium natans]|uniref:Uncharacterized protein n=1 Tax=Symbiodinium natans TaxID=878477 RepID=A0A812I4G3_9DINO|nr:unnamed protein product [Symbiodinium natans]
MCQCKTPQSSGRHSRRLHRAGNIRSNLMSGTRACWRRKWQSMSVANVNSDGQGREAKSATAEKRQHRKAPPTPGRCPGRCRCHSVLPADVQDVQGRAEDVGLVQGT